MTNVPFVDFPLTYFNVPTDPVFNASAPTTMRTGNWGAKLGIKQLALVLCLSLTVGIHLL